MDNLKARQEALRNLQAAEERFLKECGYTHAGDEDNLTVLPPFATHPNSWVHESTIHPTTRTQALFLARVKLEQDEAQARQLVHWTLRETK